MISEEIRQNYYVVFDKNKERKLSPSSHLYDPMLVDVSSALWYYLHMPRHGFDVIVSPNSLFVVGEGIQQHNIFIIPSELTESHIKLLTRYPPALYISEDSCYEKACILNNEHPSKLGCCAIQNLSATTLAEHWKVTTESVKKLLEGMDINILNISPRLLVGNERTALPNVFLANQNEDTEDMLNFLQYHGYSFKSRVYTTKRQRSLFNLYNQLDSDLESLPNDVVLKALSIEQAVTDFPLIITLPGGPSKRRTYGVHSRNDEISEEEKALINFFGVQRAISQQGVWLEGEIFPSINFSRLSILEEHFHARKQSSKFIIRTLKKFGKELTKNLGIEEIGKYIESSSKIIAFTDFPIGLAILPGYSDPLCCMVSISYRPLTPLTSTFQYGLRQLDEHYIGPGQGFKVLIVECLSKSDHIRIISDMGWSVVRNQLKDNRMVTVHYEEVDSADKLEEVISSYTDIDFLVISAHGMYSKDGIAGLSVGNDFWMPSRHSKVPPVVILSACHVAPKGKGDYTINDAFLEAGALAVLGTLIPVNVKENAMITQRFFQYIIETLEGHHNCFDLAEAWKRVVAMNAVSEILSASKKLIAWSITTNENGKTPYDEYFEEIKKSEIYPGKVHDQSIEILKRIADRAGMKTYLESVLQSQGYISESFFYLFSGYPEKIIIKELSWMERRSE
ncbi:CHAT domain-containing protein [Bacillus paramycoides]|uniref:CHAT domain-containing protein n=1 Tax=Bacillus paramycoides TaxID=2026194 RepID=UPI002E201CDB|nr:CHAT domain-containing protein [Bacillus paramycoides]